MGSIAEVYQAISDPVTASAQRPRVLELFEKAKQDGRPLNVSAPMVRYSKLPFRMLVRQYGADVIFTPMMLAHEFIRSHIARDSDYTTHPLENRSAKDDKQTAIIAQFASSDPEEFTRAAEMIAPWVDGVDLNCGCPQSWAIKEGIGCALQESSELVASIVKAAKSRLGISKSVSVKIRIHKDLEVTKRWITIVQEAGVDFITIHGRTRSQRSSTAPDYDAVRMLRPWVKVPLVANGDAYSLADVKKIAALTEADGVMAARGILENPAMFAGEEVSPECVSDFLHWAVRCPIPFPLVLHHISEMTARMPGMTKKEKRRLMECKDLLDLADFVEDKWGLARR
ncbi:Putative aldolase-type TIM barrel, tRNA-dihydrouridine synthase, DUS-like, FMN-binding protein [Septoria linicola]|uniref:Aldolase-type TIM barrel, tRNA-dihydrouridine synthase, DUS-like, FMN-binding protein n=1 Tax=Septoria linicola TaxID=215465 RepID=A0A9Q9B3L7_9PEZI|nr:putative aldolase-type TIM barrel, tRNA-dihydrouridine synthase, DUS-like, FMN-binding protein [Septoria linicola]USW55691.1 Putative aldolase-type TIM barrel, tRNA-dihydrouridine synthase, DUS-like, FMN-binding protein [Septoria linicola]